MKAITFLSLLLLLSQMASSKFKEGCKGLHDEKVKKIKMWGNKAPGPFKLCIKESGEGSENCDDGGSDIWKEVKEMKDTSKKEINDWVKEMQKRYPSEDCGECHICLSLNP